ncbi:helix-turn-helix transcriptional regulator [bacterium]|nr:helix-turn-helix transcriptional regulator [bacterium]
MKFWVQLTTETDEEGTLWHNAYTPDFKTMTQGRDLEECRKMALDLLYCHLEDRLPEARARKPRGPGWEQIEVTQSAMLALSLKRERKRQGKTMKEVADSLGVGISTYQKWENPYTFNATVQALEKVAQALGMQLQVSLAAKVA